MTERSQEVGFIRRGGIKWVWDLAADAYVPLVPKGPAPTDLGALEVAAVGEDLGSLSPEDLTRRERQTRYGEEGTYRQARRPRRGGG